mgnify:CR=1 FL=1
MDAELPVRQGWDPAEVSFLGYAVLDLNTGSAAACVSWSAEGGRKAGTITGGAGAAAAAAAARSAAPLAGSGDVGRSEAGAQPG